MDDINNVPEKYQLPCGYDRRLMNCTDCCDYEGCELIEHKQINCADCMGNEWIYCDGNSYK